MFKPTLDPANRTYPGEGEKPAGSRDHLTLTRRRFNASLAGGLALAASGGVLGAARPAAAAPVRGGLLRVALHQQSTNDTFDSARYVNPNDYIRGTTFYNALTVLDERAEAQPELAESFESNDQATRWVFKLRQGVTFHDGSPLTPADVVFSILRHKEEKVASSAKPLVTNISAVKADGANIVIDLASPDADFPILIGTFQFMIVKDGTYDFSTPIGTGPYKIKEFMPGVRTVGTRNENYWKEGRPYVDSIELFSVVDPVARLNALLSGDADMVSNVQGAGIEQLAASQDARLFTTSAPRFTDITMRLDLPPSSSRDLRLALVHLMDRQRYLDTVLKGYGQIANDHPFLPNSPLYNTEIQQRELDLDKAKHHFGKTGIGQTRVEMYVTPAAVFSTELGQLLQREASRIGLNIDLQRAPTDSYWNSIWGQRPFTAGNINARPTYDMMVSLIWKTGAPWNQTHTANPRLDALVNEGRATLELSKRKEIYGEIQQIIHDQAGNLLPAFLDYVDGISNKVKGLTPIPVGNLGGFNFADRVWLEG